MSDEHPEDSAPKQTSGWIADDPELNAKIDEFLSSQEAQSTLLHRAARSSDVALASAALEMGLDVDAQDAAGFTPLHLASTVEFAEFLIQHGAHVNARSNFGDTPLHLHTLHGRVGVVRRLLTANADPNALNNRWSSPIEQREEQSITAECKSLLAAAGSVPGPLSRYIERTSPPFVRAQQVNSSTHARDSGFHPLHLEMHAEPWERIRRFVEGWIPNTQWHCGMSEADLDAFEADGELRFPPILRQFYLSGVFDWLLRQGLGLHLAELPKFWMNVFWAPPEVVVRRPNVGILPVCYFECMRQYGLELDECDERDPPVREYADMYSIRAPADVYAFASRSLVEFVVYHVVRHILDAAPVQRVYQHTPPQELRRHAKATLSRMPFTVLEAGFLNSAYEAPDAIYLESRHLSGAVRCTGVLAARTKSAFNRLLRSSRRA